MAGFPVLVFSAMVRTGPPLSASRPASSVTAMPAGWAKTRGGSGLMTWALPSLSVPRPRRLRRGEVEGKVLWN